MHVSVLHNIKYYAHSLLGFFIFIFVSCYYFYQYVAPRRILERIGFPRLEFTSKVRGYFKGQKLLQRLKVTSKVKGYFKGQRLLQILSFPILMKTVFCVTTSSKSLQRITHSNHFHDHMNYSFLLLSC